MPTMLTVTDDQRVVHLRVGEPAALGATSTRLAWRIVDACAAIDERDDQPVAVVVSSGGDAFCVQAPESADDCDAVGEAWARATTVLASLGPPTIAVVERDAIGPAWELALACDLRIATPEVRLGSPEVRWGRMPAAGGTQRLARIVGPNSALRMLLLGEVISGNVALERGGLVHRLASETEIDSTLHTLLASLRSAAPIALAYVKEAVLRGSRLPLDDGLRLEADLAALLQTTDDRAEGVRAFLERREPRFAGR